MNRARFFHSCRNCLLLTILFAGLTCQWPDCANGMRPLLFQDGNPGPEENSGNKGADEMSRYRPAEKEPDWVQESFERETNRILVFSEYRHQAREAELELWDQVIETVRRALDDRVAKGAGDMIPLDREIIRKRFVPGDRVHTHLYYTPVPGGELAEGFGVVDSRDGQRYLEWYRGYAEIGIGEEFLEWGKQQFEAELVNNRVRQTFMVMFGVLGLFAGAFGLLTLNHQTRGLYKGKLIVLAALLLIVLALAAVAVCRSMVWL